MTAPSRPWQTGSLDPVPTPSRHRVRRQAVVGTPLPADEEPMRHPSAAWPAVTALIGNSFFNLTPAALQEGRDSPHACAGVDETAI